MRRIFPILLQNRDRRIDLDPSLRILVLSPPKEQIGDDLNTNSIVLRISYGTVNLLYTGDATTAAEEVMVKTGYPLDARGPQGRPPREFRCKLGSVPAPR